MAPNTAVTAGSAEKVAAETGGAEALATGNYEVLKRRLDGLADELSASANRLNERRKATFGGTELTLIGNERIRTENNCIPRDMVGIGGRLLVGFEVFLGLKNEMRVEDVFYVHAFDKKDGTFDLSQQSLEGRNAFLADEAFGKELRDTFRYIKGAKLSRLRRTDTRLLATVQVGDKAKGVKVFRWSIDAAQRITYMDARGDEDNRAPKSHDFV